MVLILRRKRLRVATFFEEVASQTGIAAEQQHLLYLGHELLLEGSMKVVTLPHTSPAQPLLLLSYSFEANHSLPFRERKPVPRRRRRLLLRRQRLLRLVFGVFLCSRHSGDPAQVRCSGRLQLHKGTSQWLSPHASKLAAFRCPQQVFDLPVVCR